MDHGWGSFRTTDGNVSVGHDTIRIDKTLGRFLRGQRSRWRNGDRRQQFLAAFKVFGLLVTPVFAVYQSYTVLDASIGVAAAFVLVVVLFNLIAFWWQHSRKRTIRLAAVEGVALDTDDRKLTVVHDAGSRAAALDDDSTRKWFSSADGFSVFGPSETETELTLLTHDDVREARTVLRTRGVPMEIDAAEPETETEYRFEMENGVVFCDQCGSQVSPNDRDCPSCDRTLRVERSAGSGEQRASDERERLVEF